MDKRAGERLGTPADGWIALGADTEMGPSHAQGSSGEAAWSLNYVPEEAELRHLSPDWLYRSPLPRTKLTSPAPAARFDGRLELPGKRAIELRGWRGMVGHNWGSEHAERWIWLHGIDFEQAPGAWLDIALGRVLLAGRLTPWIASGTLSMDGRRRPIGFLQARGARVQEGVGGCHVRLAGKSGGSIEIEAEVPSGSAAGWRYANPDGDEHDVVNCSIATLHVSVKAPGSAPRTLSTAHGGAYELGMRERDHGVAIAPFPDG